MKIARVCTVPCMLSMIRRTGGHNLCMHNRYLWHFVILYKHREKNSHIKSMGQKKVESWCGIKELSFVLYSDLELAWKDIRVTMKQGKCDVKLGVETMCLAFNQWKYWIILALSIVVNNFNVHGKDDINGVKLWMGTLEKKILEVGTWGIYMISLVECLYHIIVASKNWYFIYCNFLFWWQKVA